MKKLRIKLTPVALLVINSLGCASVYAAETPVSCYADSTTRTFHCADGSTATEKNTMAIGLNATTTGPRAIAIGAPDNGMNNSVDNYTPKNTSASADGIAIGTGATVTDEAPGGVAIGSRRHQVSGEPLAGPVNSGATVYAINGVAIGAGAVAGSSGKGDFRTVAIGDSAKVSGNLNIGLGPGLVVGDGSDSSVSIGYGSAIGRQISNSSIFENASKATAVGYGAEVMKGSDRSTGLGSQARVLQGTTQSLALGNNSVVNTGANNSTAIGSYASVGTGALNAIALGGGSDGNNAAKVSQFATEAIAIGSQATASGEKAVVIGAGANVAGGGNWGIAIGHQAAVSAISNGIALGRGAKASGSNSTAVGEGASAANISALAFGTGAQARDIDNIAIGHNATAQNSDSVSLASAIAIGKDTRALQNNTLAIGAGSGAISSGAVAFGPSATAGNTDLTTPGNNAIAVGYLASAPVQNTLALGHGATATGVQGIAMGYNAKSSAEEAVAVGMNSDASGANAIALGNGAKATAENTISIGKGNTVSGVNSGAIGDPSTVSGTGSYSFGNNNTITGNNAFVLGNGVSNVVDNSVVLGNSSTVSAAVATPAYTVNGVSHAFAGTAPVSTVSIGDAGKERTLTNVAAGRISSASTDAVNGSQLFAVTSEMDKGSLFAGNTGTFNRRLGDTTTISGGLDASAAASNKNIRTEAKDGLIDIQLADNLDVTSVKAGNTRFDNDGLHITGGPSVTVGGIDAGNKAIGNVGDAVNDTDAVNKRQFDNLSTTVGKGLTFAANEGSNITRKPGEVLALKGNATVAGSYSGGNIKTVTDPLTGTISIQMADSPVFGSVVINDNNSGKITGVSDGTISEGSQDVVNGGQIHRVTTSIGNVIGGDARVDADGSLVASNIGNTGKSTLHDAIDSVRNAAETAGAGWNLSVNGEQSGAVKPKDTVDLNNTDGNISITKKDNQVSFNLSDSVKFKDSVGVENGPSLSRTGIDGAGMKITNVADGTIAAGSKDAVNGGQIHDFVSGEVTRPMTFAADSGTPYEARLGTTVNVKGDDKNIHTAVNGNTLSVSLNENINVKSVTATESLSVASGASVDMGGNPVHNVGNATRPGDAVNYGQFQQAFSSLGNQINRVERRANAGAAAAIATAGLTQAYAPGKSMMSMSGGTFQGESSLAIGLSTISDNGNWVLKGSFSSTTRNQTGASVGVGFQF
ncbi:hypothetical protein WP66_004791 [Salmonella enterica subsp. enterica]|nr:hypothetical protein [Salmonella enterica subsp. enterica]